MKSPSRRAKIKAIADDPRGNPVVRARAKEWLERHPEPASGVVHGVRPSDAYIAWVKAQHIGKKR